MEMGGLRSMFSEKRSSGVGFNHDPLGSGGEVVRNLLRLWFGRGQLARWVRQSHESRVFGLSFGRPPDPRRSDQRGLGVADFELIHEASRAAPFRLPGRGGDGCDRDWSTRHEGQPGGAGFGSNLPQGRANRSRGRGAHAPAGRRGACGFSTRVMG